MEMLDVITEKRAFIFADRVGPELHANVFRHELFGHQLESRLSIFSSRCPSILFGISGVNAGGRKINDLTGFCPSILQRQAGRSAASAFILCIREASERHPNKLAVNTRHDEKGLRAF